MFDDPRQGNPSERIKKIAVDQLRPGMFVHDLDCRWFDHPFLRNRFLVRDDETVAKIAAYGIRELYIDTERGDDVLDAPTAPEVRRDIERRIVTLADLRQAEVRSTSLPEEKRRAALLRKEARDVVRTLLDDVRLGQSLDVDRVDPLLEKMMDSLFRHVDALIPLVRWKEHAGYAFEHAVASAALMIAFGRNLGLDRATIRDIALGAMLQDVGMVRVPHAIVDKPGKLTEAEYRVMQNHVPEGEHVLEQVGGVSDNTLLVLRQHHERFDGTGYPGHLSGEALSIFGQMGAIVDVYDALTSTRPYDRAMTPTAALRKLLEWSTHHFDPRLVHAFIRTVGIYPVGSLVRLENGALGIVVEQRQDNLLKPVVRIVYNTNKGSLVEPFLVDLAKHPPPGYEQIVGPESYERYSLDPRRWQE